VKQSIDKLKPRFIEEQSGTAAPLPAFVTRTTLRDILREHGTESLIDLGANSPGSERSESTISSFGVRDV
jgi:hypothetical protein